MKKSKTMLYVILCGLFLQTEILLADFATPFVEINNQVGDVSEVHAFIAALGSWRSKDREHYLVIVPTDFGEYVVIDAVASKGIVKEGLLGREILLKAEVLERIENKKIKQPKIKLKLLSVEPITTKVKPKEQAQKNIND